MPKILPVVFISTCIWLCGNCQAQTAGQWSWEAGDSLGFQLPKYLPAGYTDSSLTPGNLQQSGYCTDKFGNTWVYGGTHATDAKNGSVVSTFWKLNPDSLKWTYISGSHQQTLPGDDGPGSRLAPALWADSNGNIWLFGNLSSSNWNDLWMYDIAKKEWTSRLSVKKAVYGTKGVAKDYNRPPARFNAMYWTDKNGKLWLFGGKAVGYFTSAPLLNDLWRFDPDSNLWTWMSGDTSANKEGVYGTKGTPAATNKPGSRMAGCGFAAGNGDFYLWGGYGYDDYTGKGYMNDMWKYSPSTGMWVWLRGPEFANNSGYYLSKGSYTASSLPRARMGATCSINANGELLIMGGQQSFNSALLNDVWTYRTDLNQWAWQAGDVTNVWKYGKINVADSGNKLMPVNYALAAPGAGNRIWFYSGNSASLHAAFWSFDTTDKYPVWRGGDIGQFAPASLVRKGMKGVSLTPGSTLNGCLWAGKDGKIWKFGGYDSWIKVTNNELWSLTTATGEWMLEDGNLFRPAVPVYGAKGVEAVANYPGVRYSASYWNDTAGCFWLFGGATAARITDELWRYNPATNMWAWIGGDSATASSTNGKYVNKGVADTGWPAGRHSANIWISDSALWLFGGYRYNSVAGNGYMQDAWKYSFQTKKWTWLAGNDVLNQKGRYPLKPGTVHFWFAPGSRMNAACWAGANGRLWMFGGEGYGQSLSQNIYSDRGLLNDLWYFDTDSSLWVFMGGSKLVNPLPQLGIKGVRSKQCWPGPANGQPVWNNRDGSFSLFGDKQGNSNYRQYSNRVWKYYPNVNQWVWCSGDSVPPHYATYGTKKIPSAYNIPGGRSLTAFTRGTDSMLWLFGGHGSLSTINVYSQVNLADLWKLTRDTCRISADFSFNTSKSCAGVTLQFTNHSNGAASYLWHFGNGPADTSTTVSPQHTFSTISSPLMVLKAFGKNGCVDSLVQQLDIDSARTTFPMLSVCSGTPVYFGNDTLTQSGTYIDTLASASGCDSVVTLQLTVLPNYHFHFYDTICQGNMVNWQGVNYQYSGSYSRYFNTKAGCDSTLVLHLHVPPPPQTVFVDSFCQGDSYTYQGKTYFNTVSTVVAHKNAATGCDSLSGMYLKMLPRQEVFAFLSICPGFTVKQAGKKYNKPGMYTDTLASISGCDSIVHLTIIQTPPSPLTYDSITLCSGQSIVFGKHMIDRPGVYTDTLTSASGCDSAVQLTVSYVKSSSSVGQIKICPGDSFLLKNNWLKLPGAYQDTLVNADGCDSVVKVYLQVYPLGKPTIYSDFVDLQWVTLNEATINWLSGNGLYHLVVLRKNRFIDPSLMNDNRKYAANGTFGLGDSIDGGVVLYDTIGTGLTIAGLNKQENYYATVVEHNQFGSCHQYFTALVGMGYLGGINGLTPAEHELAAGTLQVYPNPGLGQFKVQLLHQHTGIAKLEMINELGQPVLLSHYPAAGHVFRLDGAAGIYLILVTTTEGQRFTARLVKE